MNILIDAHMVGERETGNETYMVNLIRGLQSLESDDQFLLATPSASRLGRRVDLTDQFRPVLVSDSSVRRILLGLPRLVKKEAADVLHVTYAGPPRVACPLICSVHDVAYKFAPEWFSPRDKLVLEAGVGTTIRRCDMVMTISDFSVQEIQAAYRVPASRIRRTWLAASEAFTPDPQEGDAERVDWLVSGRPYFLAVGNLQPRKNLLRAIEAYALARDQGALEQQLVIVGKEQWKHEALRSLVEQYQLQDHVRFTGYVEDEDLPLLYRSADVFMYPSLYEGFGLPVLEAMACGTAVICSDRASLPEVAGDAGRYIDPEDVQSMSSAMMELGCDANLRQSLSLKGIEQAARFSWKETARQTLDVYREVLGP